MDTPPARSRRPRIVALTTAGLVLLGTAIGVYVATNSSGHRATAAPPPPVSSSVPAPTTTPPPAPKPTRPPPARPTIPHDYVAPAVPTSFTITGKQFTVRAHVCAMANIRPYDPPGEQHHTVCWVRSGFGVKPSSTQPATSYVFGHAWAEDAQEVLNRVSEPATGQLLHAKPTTVNGVPVYPVSALDGYFIKLQSRTGTLTYRVRDAYGVAKDQLGFIKSWLDPRVPGRVLLTTCAERNGVDYDYNIILAAYLYSSQSAASPV